MVWPSEISVPLSSVANRHPLKRCAKVAQLGLVGPVVTSNGVVIVHECIESHHVQLEIVAAIPPTRIAQHRYVHTEPFLAPPWASQVRAQVQVTRARLWQRHLLKATPPHLARVHACAIKTNGPPLNAPLPSRPSPNLGWPQKTSPQRDPRGKARGRGLLSRIS